MLFEVMTHLSFCSEHMGYDATAGTPIEYKPDNAEAVNEDWRLLADQLLPRTTLPIACTLSLNDEGLPLFPAVDMDSITTTQLQEVFKVYSGQVWGK
jgi:hypothetical protein